MKKINKIISRAGFTLVELMLSVAIVATLCGFGFVSVMQQRRNLSVLEADETAKEIFLAAQEHLSMAAVQGRLHTDAGGLSKLGLQISGVTLGVEVSGESEKSYAIFDNMGSGANGGGEGAVTLSAHVSDVMLPDGSIDAFVLNHHYAIRYDRDTYRVLEVFYTEDDYVFQHGTGDFWTDLANWDTARDLVQRNPGSFRVDSQKPVIMGWYGEEALLFNASGALGNLVKPSNPQGIKPGITVVNGPILYAEIALDANYTYSEASLKIQGVNGGAVSIPIAFKNNGDFDELNSSPRVYQLSDGRGNEVGDGSGVSYFIVILDDVTTDGMGFSDLFADYPEDGDRIALGSDIRVTAEAVGSQTPNGGGDDDQDANSIVLSGSSNTVTRNSLFADGSGPNDAHIQNFRHLQNLDQLFSEDLDSAAGETVNAAMDQSLYWTSFTEEIKSTHGQYVSDYDINTDTVSYKPPIWTIN